MTTLNILLTRIDNRLVHGQVGVTWANSLSVNLLLVANDQAASDPVQQNLMDRWYRRAWKPAFLLCKKQLTLFIAPRRVNAFSSSAKRRKTY